MLCRLSNMSDGANTPRYSPKASVPQIKGKRRLPSQLSSPAALLPRSAAVVQCQVLFTQPSRSRDKGHAASVWEAPGHGDSLSQCTRRGHEDRIVTLSHRNIQSHVCDSQTTGDVGQERRALVPHCARLPVPGEVGTDPAQLAPALRREHARRKDWMRQ